MAAPLRVRVEGVGEVRRAITRLPQGARDEMRDHCNHLADELKRRIVRAAAARGRQSAKAARSVKVVKNRLLPTIQGGGTTKAGQVFLGTEFGAKRRFGWYAHPRYFRSLGRQFPAHRGRSSYWFLKTVDQNSAFIQREVQFMADDVVRRWRA